MNVNNLLKKTIEAHKQLQFYECLVETTCDVYSTIDFCENTKLQIQSALIAPAKISWKKVRTHPALGELVLGEGFVVLDKEKFKHAGLEDMVDALSVASAVEWLARFAGSAGLILELQGYLLNAGLVDGIFDSSTLHGISYIEEFQCHHLISQSGIEFWVDKHDFLLRKIREFAIVESKKQPQTIETARITSENFDDLTDGISASNFDVIHTIEQTKFRYLLS